MKYILSDFVEGSNLFKKKRQAKTKPLSLLSFNPFRNLTKLNPTFRQNKSKIRLHTQFKCAL